MNTLTNLPTNKSLPVYKSLNDLEGYSDTSLLFFHAADPVELSTILEESLIRTNHEMTESSSLRLLPGLSDCVDLYSVDDLRFNFRYGVGLVLDANELDTYIPHYGPKDFQPLVRELHMGSIDLRDSLIGLYAVSDSLFDLQMSHPEISLPDFLRYLELRKSILPKSSMITSGFENDFSSVNAKFAKSVMADFNITNTQEFLHLLANRYIDKN